MQVIGINGGRKTMEIRWLTKTRTKRKLTIPIYISTDPSHVNPQLLQNLFTTCNHSSHRFPKLSHEGTLLEAVDINKLSIALSHSFLLVSVFCNSQDLVDADADDGDQLPHPLMGLGDFLQRRLMPLSLLSPSQRQLVGFGRAVSDCGLTASIHDVMVVPSLRRMGIGRMIVRRLVRMLTNRDIYDIAALCSASERMFFEACSFGDDILGSTTMMYARTVSNHNEGDEKVVCAGRKLLGAPPLRLQNGYSKMIKS